MQSKGAKIGFIALVILIFGGAMYYMYGPNSNDAKQKERDVKTYQNFVKTEAEVINTVSNGYVGKANDIIYTFQFKDEKTQQLVTAEEDGSHLGWVISKSKGDKVVLYYDPSNPKKIVSENYYNDAMK